MLLRYNSMIKTFSAFLIFLFLYPFSLAVFPQLTSRLILALFGTVLIGIRIINMAAKRKIVVKKKIMGIYVAAFVVSAVALFSSFYNNQADFEFVTLPISITVAFFAVYFIYSVDKKFIVPTERFVIESIILAVTFQCLLSFILFLRPDIQDAVYSLVSTSELRLSKIEELSGGRIIGFGRSFFEAGIYNGMALMFIAYCIRYYKLSNKELSKFVILYAFIFGIGMMMARTTLVGAALSLLILLSSNNFNLRSVSRKKLKFFSMLIIVPLGMVYLFLTLFPGFVQNLERLFRFGFELFINLSETGSLETTSTTGMFEMYIFPDNMKTWLIGDALWDDPFSDGTSFYMGTDIGYSRMIFFFGIIGTLCFFIYQYIFIKYSINKRLPTIIFFIYVLALNTKGMADISYMLIPLAIINYYSATHNTSMNQKRSKLY